MTSVMSDLSQELGELVDVIHVLQSIGFVLGGFLLPPRALPFFLFCVIYMLARYHDYCVLSEFSRVLKEHAADCKAEGGEFSQRWRDVADRIGVPMASEFQQNMNTALVGISGFVAAYRLARAVDMPLFSPFRAQGMSTVLVYSILLLILSGEVATHWWHGKRLPFCDPATTEPAWTPA